MKGDEIVRVVTVSLLVIILWGVYFAVCGAPQGATFIYADF
jgi:hypothetical protein